MSKVLIYSQEDLDLILELEKQENEELQQENKQLKQRIDKAIEILGEYRHYGTPDEEQNLENEDKVDEAFDILKGE